MLIIALSILSILLILILYPALIISSQISREEEKREKDKDS